MPHTTSSNADGDEKPNADASIDLCLLVRQQRIDQVRTALEEDRSLLKQHRWSGVHPLHRAVASGDLEMVALLLEFGANANERAAWGWYSPLHLACKHGHEQIIWKLLEHGAEWSLTDKVGRVP